jgi:glutamyl-Q tRNA(Asp) synthetase
LSAISDETAALFEAPRPPRAYRGRFAPSPTGPLHCGSLVAALASWLDARAHDGAWLVRIEDIDPPREVAGAAQDILATLSAFGLEGDEPPIFQSGRTDLFVRAFERLEAAELVYACACSRSEVEAAIAARRGWPAGVYPGTCAIGLARNRSVRSWRIRVPQSVVRFEDRCAGPFEQTLSAEVGDFVVRRAEGLWAYQLAVVVDDAASGITHVVRGADLLDNTPRQIFLQGALDVPTPQYLHVPVVKTASGEKLSKQTGARPLARDNVLSELERAWRHLGFPRLGADSPSAFLRRTIALWRERWSRTDTIIGRESADGR